MKPLRLRMQAFGPYANVAEVNFSSMADGGLFLIHGPTGAGKTSILDGLCFALFGGSSCGTRTADGMRCDSAPADLASEVELEFALGRDRYRVVRRPRQQVKKQRGDGFTNSLPQGHFFRLDNAGSWQLVTSGDKKTDECVAELLGMDADQFRQVVVLPQGKFRKFLSAASSDREELLQTLFRAEKYRSLCDHLSRRARELEAKVQSERQSYQAQLTSLGVEDFDSLGRLITETSEKLKAIEDAGTELEERYQLALQRKTTAQTAAKLKGDLAQIETKSASLTQREPEIVILRQRLEDEKRSRPVLVLDRQVASLQGEVSRLTTECQNERKHLVEGEQRLSTTRARAAELQSLASSVEAKKNEQVGLRELWQNANRFNTELQVYNESLRKLTAAEARHGSAEVALREGRVSLLTEIKLRDLRAENLSKQCDAAWKSAIDAEKNLRLSYHLSQAALLARELRPGEPCLVCGSADHPHPAKESTDVTIDQLEAAQKLANSAAVEAAKTKEIASTARETRLKFESRWPELSAQITVDKPSAIRAELRMLEANVHQLETLATAAANGLAEARAHHETSQARLIELEKLVPEDKRDLKKIEARGVELKREVETYAKECQENARSIEAVLLDVTTRRATVASLVKQTEDRTAETMRLKSECQEALAQSGFDTVELCRNARLEETQITQFEKQVRLYEDDLTLVTNRLGELKSELASVPEWAHDLESRLHEFTQADHERSSRRAELLSHRERLTILKQAEARLTDLAAEITKLDQRYAILGKLAAVGAGQPPHNLSRVNFSRYVLATKLDDVLQQASRRLSRMSRGQFTLKRATNPDDKRRAAGLDLEVEDSFTGTTRPTASLSGGEGFMASLALALGLGDVVQSQLGGIRLDAVFVDEGFGTLDSDALELAMQTLNDLQSGGRLVGIISHVPELKDQIARRLHVRKTTAGSQVGWEGPSANQAL